MQRHLNLPNSSPPFHPPQPRDWHMKRKWNPCFIPPGTLELHCAYKCRPNRTSLHILWFHKSVTELSRQLETQLRCLRCIKECIQIPPGVCPHGGLLLFPTPPSRPGAPRSLPRSCKLAWMSCLLWEVLRSSWLTTVRAVGNKTKNKILLVLWVCTDLFLEPEVTTQFVIQTEMQRQNFA